MPHTGSQGHQFARPRPSGNGNYNTHVKTPQEHRDTHFRPLPDPTGAQPFHLDLANVVSAQVMADIKRAKKLVFHINGDMGGIDVSMPQILVAKGMEADFAKDARAADNPAFLYILGDCVYFNGETAKYQAQFFEPYKYYPAPIFAVPGNHDGENLPGQSNLDGFLRFFCADHPYVPLEAGDSGRSTMTQPNVYWTLRTPLVNFVGLYSNVPEGGDIRSPQVEWLAQQLKSLPKDVPLFLTLHHPVYSADVFHSGSTHMKELLEQAVASAGRHPDVVLAGHVHDYQRISKDMGGGKVTPFIVAGAGGYHNLHAIMKVDGQKLVAPCVFQDKNGASVTLERYSDDNHGFLRLEVTEDTITGRYYTVPRPQDDYSKGSALLDYFEYDWRKRKYIPNHLKTSTQSPAVKKKGKKTAKARR